MATVEEIIGRAKADLLLAAKMKMLAAAEEMVLLTPTRTGRTRSSFVASIGQPATGTDPKLSGGPIDHDGAGALAAIAEVIDTIKPGDVLYVTSDYGNATRMDEGDRHIAPHQMAERAAADWARQ